MTSKSADLIRICTAGESAWHAAAYKGLDAEWRVDSDLAWGPDGAPHRFLLAAVTLVERPALPGAIRDMRLGVVRDSWAALTAVDLPGWISSPFDPWMALSPGRCDSVPAPGIVVEETDDALLFEHTAFVGSGGPPPAQPGELHPAGSSKKIEDFHLFLAYRNGAPVGTSLAVRHETGVVISAVNVVESERRQGIGAMLTTAGAGVGDGLSATLTASKLGIGVYRRLGFSELGTPLHWFPPKD